jgi:hypothetical protein
MPLKQPYPHMYTHQLHFGPRVAHCPEATHVCIVRAPVPPPHTHVPAPPHTLTPSHIPSLLLGVPRLSSGLPQASGMGHQAGLVLSSRTPIHMYLSHPMLLACRRRPLDTGTAGGNTSSVCRTMVHSARTPTTRPLPRPAAIASRHATSRAMQVTSGLLLWHTAPAALSSPHSPCLSLVHASPHARPYTVRRPRGEGGGCLGYRPPKPEWMTPL